MDKVAYLQNQVDNLRADIADLHQVISINKTEIDILSKQLQANPQTKKLIDVIYGYRNRQEDLQKNILKSKEQIIKINSDNLVLRQLNEEQSQEIKNTQVKYQEIIEELHKSIRKLEEKNLFYERNHKQYDKISGFVLKNREIFSPQDMVMELKGREEELNHEIHIMKVTLEESKKAEENLLMVNTVLRNKIISLQAKLAVPNKYLGEVLDKSLKKLMLHFIQVQKKIVEGNLDSDSQEQEDMELIAPELAGLFPEKKIRTQKDFGVPHLDLLKIRDQIMQSSSKIKEALLARNHLSDKQKIERLQIELEYTRRQLSRKIIDIKEQKEQRKKLERINSELQERNNLLINSNTNLEKRAKKLWDKVQEQKEKILENTGAVDNTFYEEPTAVIKPKKEEPIKQSLMTLSQIDYKIHLELMAKEINCNQKLKNIDGLKKKNLEENAQNQPQLKRTSSNPFLYFNERRQQILQVKPEQQENYRLEQTYCVPGRNVDFQEVLDDIDIDL